jgi:hypothetical protein
MNNTTSWVDNVMSVLLKIKWNLWLDPTEREVVLIDRFF